jgi:Leucine-rich repeat
MADALTVGIIQAKSKTDNLKMISKLNLSGIGFEDISILRQMPNLEVVSLPVNRITSLKEFQYLTKLTDLSVRKNNISQISNLLYLRQLPNLKNLWMMENPISSQANYRLLVVALLPHLEKLDNKEVTAEERAAARQVDVGNIENVKEQVQTEKDQLTLKPKLGWDQQNGSQVANRKPPSGANHHGMHRSKTDIHDVAGFDPKESNLNAKLDWSVDGEDEKESSIRNPWSAVNKAAGVPGKPRSPRGQWSKPIVAAKPSPRESNESAHERYSSAPVHHENNSYQAKNARISPNEHVIFAIMELVKELNPIELDYIKKKVESRFNI